MLALGDTFWAAAARYPEYSRQITYCYSCSARPLFEIINASAIPTLHAALTKLQLRNGLKERVDTLSITNRLAALGAITMLRWAEGHRTLEETRKDLALGWGLILLGVVERFEQSRIEDWLDSILSTAHV